MGYRITYETGVHKTELLLPTRKRTKLGYIALACVLIIALALGHKYWQVLLPGDPKVTERALHELASDLREGESVSDAVTAFCREILENA